MQVQYMIFNIRKCLLLQLKLPLFLLPLIATVVLADTNTTLSSEDANVTDRYVQVPIEDTDLQEYNKEDRPLVDTVAFKLGVGHSFVDTIKDNGGVVGVIDPDTVGGVESLSLVFNTDFNAYVKPYIDINVIWHQDRRFIIPGLGLRHDFMQDDKTFEPFVSLGLGYNYMNWKKAPVVFPGVDAAQSGGQSMTVTAQGGMDFYFSEKIALDLTMRYDSYDIGTEIVGNGKATTLQDNATLSLMLGLVYRFGENNGEGDDDIDGVKNSKDYCPSMVSGAEVDQFGCALDDDKDKIINMFDQCPETIAGAPVDINGCALDSDDDLVIDLYDRCPDTLKNVPVSQCGCPPYKFDFNLNYEFAKFKIESLKNNPTFDIVAFLKKWDNYNVRLTGNSDKIGSTKFNKKLSKERADEAMAYLKGHGISEDRIHIIARGKGEGLVKGDTPENRTINRRLFIELYRTDKTLVRNRPVVVAKEVEDNK